MLHYSLFKEIAKSYQLSGPQPKISEVLGCLSKLDPKEFAKGLIFVELLKNNKIEKDKNNSQEKLLAYILEMKEIEKIFLLSVGHHERKKEEKEFRELIELLNQYLYSALIEATKSLVELSVN